MDSRRFTATLFALTTLLVSALGTPAFASPACSRDSELGKKLNLPIYEWSDPDHFYKGTIVAVHGLTFYAAAYDDLASYLALQGYRVIAVDMRGFGRWRCEHEKFGGDNQLHFSQSREDLLKVVRSLRDQSPNMKIFAMGESLGANLALDLVSNNPDLCDGLILGSPCYKAKVHPKPQWVADFFRGLRHPNKPLNLTPYITPYLSHNKSLTTSCLKDPKICRNLSVVELIKAKKTNDLALTKVDKIKPQFPVLVIAGGKDGVYKTSSLSQLFNRFGTKEIDVNIFPERGHLLLEHQEVNQDIAAIFDRWLTQQAGAEQVVQLP